MNDPDTLGFYTTMQLFINNPEAEGATLQFPPTLTPRQRQIVHSLAIKLNLDHSSHSVGTGRYVTVATPRSPADDRPILTNGLRSSRAMTNLSYRPN